MAFGFLQDDKQDHAKRVVAASTLTRALGVLQASGCLLALRLRLLHGKPGSSKGRRESKGVCSGLER